MIVAIVIGLLVTALYELIPVTLLGLFSASDYMLSIGVTAVRLCALSIVFGSVCVIISSACQSFGRSRYTMLINLCRQVVFQVAAAWILSRFGRLEIVWLSTLIAEILTMVIAICLCRKVIAMLREIPAAEGRT